MPPPCCLVYRYPENRGSKTLAHDARIAEAVLRRRRIAPRAAT